MTADRESEQETLSTIETLLNLPLGRVQDNRRVDSRCGGIAGRLTCLLCRFRFRGTKSHLPPSYRETCVHGLRVTIEVFETSSTRWLTVTSRRILRCSYSLLDIEDTDDDTCVCTRRFGSCGVCPSRRCRNRRSRSSDGPEGNRARYFISRGSFGTATRWRLFRSEELFRGTVLQYSL